LTSGPKPGYVPALDWMKAIGIALIVHGHVAARTAEWLTPPFYPKQVGVALFVFATGFTLARERRSVAQILFNRLFEVMVVALAAAAAMSAVGLVLFHDPAESNYLPLVGLHVLLGDLPANPTTWYVGTYLHLLLVWALVFRRRRPSWKVVRLVFALDIGVRAALVVLGGPHRAYMAVFNWLDILLVGSVMGRTDVEAAPPRWWAAAVVPVAWPVAVGAAGWLPSFPFMTLTNVGPLTGALVLSGTVSVGYAAYTWSIWTITRLLPAAAWVRFLSRNTIVVFVAHMPVYYLLEYTLARPVPGFAVRAAIEFVICLVGLAFVSEWIHRAGYLRSMKQWLEVRLGWSPGAAPVAGDSIVHE